MNKKTYLAAAIILTSLTACGDNHLSTEHKQLQEEKVATLQATKPPRSEPMAVVKNAGKKHLQTTAARISAPMERAVMPASPLVGASSPMKEQDAVFLPVREKWNRESYDGLDENGFIACLNDPLSTFSIDVDTASYANIRRFVTQGSIPPVGAVRIEEMINYFQYDYPQPAGNRPIAVSSEVGPSPYNTDFSLVKIGIKAKDIEQDKLPPSNMVFLVDVSGSMNHPNKLGLLKQSLRMLVSNLGKNDRISIVAYAGSDHIALEPTSGDEKVKILEAVEDLYSAGSTHASQGIHTAYELAKKMFIPGGNNRVILASDGDFNVGITSRGELKKLIAKQRESGIYLTVLGYGMGNYHDDTMEVLADTGNGNYAYIDSLLEARKVLVKEMTGTLFTLANDVKIQVEFNPAKVGAYRLIGYENRALADEDFVNDKKDAGEIGAGHTVTALYEIIPNGHSAVPHVDKLKYQQLRAVQGEAGNEVLTVKVRYKEKGAAGSKEISQSLQQNNTSLVKMSDDFRFAAAVAGYGMLLRDSAHLGAFTWDTCMELIRGAKGKDSEGYRAELQRLVEMSRLLKENG